MIGWILRHVREFKCEHKWGEVHEISTYGRTTIHGEMEETSRPTAVRKVYICSKCLGKRVVKL